MRLLKEKLSLVVLSILVSSAAIGHASDTCTNVKFKFTNQHNSGGTIEVRQVEYFNKANGKWKTENVKVFDCPQGHTCTTSGDNLTDAEGEELTKFQFIYRYKGTHPSDNWSDDVPGDIKTPGDPTCFANKTYGPGDKGFIIFGQK